MSGTETIVIHHPSDQCVAEVIEFVQLIRCHPGPIIAFLDAAATLQSDGELTPISPLYGSIGCVIHRLSDDPAGPIVAIRGAIIPMPDPDDRPIGSAHPRATNDGDDDVDLGEFLNDFIP
jgi:hypothetical protein